MEIVYRKLSSLKPNPKNPRKATEGAIKELANSIKGNPKFFEARPILLSDRTGELVIIAGERRSEAAALLGLDMVPTILVPGLTEAQEEEILIRDNTHAGKWDEAKLSQWGKEQLQSWDVEGVRWPKTENEVRDDDFDPDKETETRCKAGDIWQLGRHRLMCGDSTKREDVAALVGGAKLELALTDPPYGIKVVITNGERNGMISAGWGAGLGEDSVFHPIKGDDTTETARLSYDVMKAFTKEQIIFGGNYFTGFLPPKPCWVVWDKLNGDSVFADAELAWTSFERGIRLFPWMWNGMQRQGDRKTEGTKRVHPSQKPVGLFVRILEEFSKEGDSVLDLFAGSGTTIIAAEQTNRVAYLMEYETFYCDVILSRWEQFTGQKATRIQE